MRYPSEEASRVVADDGEGSGDESLGPGAGKPGRAVALKSLRKGEAPENVALRLAEYGHGHWSAQELADLKSSDRAARGVSGGVGLGGCLQSCLSRLSSCWRGCWRGGRGMYTLITAEEAPISPNATVWLPLRAPGAKEEDDSRAAAGCASCCGGERGRGSRADGSSEQGCAGWVEVEMELLPAEEALQRPAAEAQNKPNDFPFLPPPARVKMLDLIVRPDRILYEILGPDLCSKVALLLVVLALIVGLVQTMPLIITNLYSTSRITSSVSAVVSPSPLPPPPPPSSGQQREASNAVLALS